MRTKQVVSGLLVALTAVAIIFLLVIFAPRTSVVLFVLIAIPAVVAARIMGWRRKMIEVCAIVGVAVLAISPVDVALSVHEEKKGVFFLPAEYGTGGGIDAGYHSLGCIVHPSWTYVPRYVVLMSV